MILIVLLVESGIDWQQRRTIAGQYIHTELQSVGVDGIRADSGESLVMAVPDLVAVVRSWSLFVCHCGNTQPKGTSQIGCNFGIGQPQQPPKLSTIESSLKLCLRSNTTEMCSRSFLHLQ